MPYSISGTTITVSGTIDLLNVALPEIFRINFAPGGASATFNAFKFIGVLPLGTSYTVIGSAADDVLRIKISDSSFGFDSIQNMSSFSFQNWGSNDIVVLEGDSHNNQIWGSYQKDILIGGDGDDGYNVAPGDIVD